MACFLDYTIDSLFPFFPFSPKIKPTMKLNLPSMRMKVHFDQDKEAELDGHDYRPLSRITWRSAIMGVLVSMGGLM